MVSLAPVRRLICEEEVAEEVHVQRQLRGQQHQQVDQPLVAAIGAQLREDLLEVHADAANAEDLTRMATCTREKPPAKRAKACIASALAWSVVVSARQHDSPRNE